MSRLVQLRPTAAQQYDARLHSVSKHGSNNAGDSNLAEWDDFSRQITTAHATFNKEYGSGNRYQRTPGQVRALMETSKAVLERGHDVLPFGGNTVAEPGFDKPPCCRSVHAISSHTSGVADDEKQWVAKVLQKVQAATAEIHEKGVGGKHRQTMLDSKARREGYASWKTAGGDVGGGDDGWRPSSIGALGGGMGPDPAQIRSLGGRRAAGGVPQQQPLQIRLVPYRVIVTFTPLFVQRALVTAAVSHFSQEGDQQPSREATNPPKKAPLDTFGRQEVAFLARPRGGIATMQGGIPRLDERALNRLELEQADLQRAKDDQRRLKAQQSSIGGGDGGEADVASGGSGRSSAEVKATKSKLVRVFTSLLEPMVAKIVSVSWCAGSSSSSTVPSRVGGELPAVDDTLVFDVSLEMVEGDRASRQQHVGSGGVPAKDNQLSTLQGALTSVREHMCDAVVDAVAILAEGAATKPNTTKLSS